MFALGLTYRPGFLVNSWELAGLVHVPSTRIFERRNISLEVLETLPVTSEELLEGTCIGSCDCAGKSSPVCVPRKLRTRHTDIIGRQGMGKSTVLEHMALDGIRQGEGAAFLDPHGDSVERLLCLAPEEHVARTIYFNPGDIDWVPLWNPMQTVPGQDHGRMADNLVDSIRSVVTGWGDRLEALLRFAFLVVLQVTVDGYSFGVQASACRWARKRSLKAVLRTHQIRLEGLLGLFPIRNATLLDVSALLRRDSPESESLTGRVAAMATSEMVKRFWLHDFAFANAPRSSWPQTGETSCLSTWTPNGCSATWLPLRPRLRNPETKPTFLPLYPAKGRRRSARRRRFVAWSTAP